MNVLYHRRLKAHNMSIDIELTREVTGYALFEQRSYSRPIPGVTIDGRQCMTKEHGQRELKQWFEVKDVTSQAKAIEAAVDHVRRLERIFDIAGRLYPVPNSAT